MKTFFAKFDKANPTINFKKGEIGEAHVTYLGHIVDQDKVAPKLAKVQAVLGFPNLSDKRGVQRFLDEWVLPKVLPKPL